MSASYYAISNYDFSIKSVRNLYESLNQNSVNGFGKWTFSGQTDKPDKELLNDVEQEYIALWAGEPGSGSAEILITKNALAVSEFTLWKYFLYEKATRDKALGCCIDIANVLNLSKQIYAPDMTFLSTSPFELFVAGETFDRINSWTKENLREIDSFDEFQGRESHHDVYFKRE